MTALRFTLADLEHAHDEWRCNCGPASLAAICGLTLEEARACFLGFKGWVNPTQMMDALKGIRRHFRCQSGGLPSWPTYGLARIQFEGPWTAPGASPRWAYRHTHWVGVSRLQLQGGSEDPNSVCVWDCNAMAIGHGWSPLAWWSSRVVPSLTADIPRASGGWHVTHAIEVER